MTAEVTPHHFTLTEDAVIRHGTLAKMNPPLRTEEDRQAIIAGLRDGTIDIIATDHAPHSEEEKARPLTEAPSGIIGLETALALGITELVRPGHLTLMQLMELGGERSIALGGDLDGCSQLPEGFRGVEDWERLWERLLQRNYSEALLRALFFENLMRVVSEVCTM